MGIFANDPAGSGDMQAIDASDISGNCKFTDNSQKITGGPGLVVA